VPRTGARSKRWRHLDEQPGRQIDAEPAIGIRRVQPLGQAVVHRLCLAANGVANGVRNCALVERAEVRHEPRALAEVVGRPIRRRPPERIERPGQPLGEDTARLGHVDRDRGEPVEVVDVARPRSAIAMTRSISRRVSVVSSKHDVGSRAAIVAAHRAGSSSNASSAFVSSALGRDPMVHRLLCDLVVENTFVQGRSPSSVLIPRDRASPAARR
jgi:hypothetical protein